MEIYSVEQGVLRKRVPTLIDRTANIQRYGLDNLYPQRSEEIHKRSYTVKSAVKRYANFIAGDGFEDPVLASLIIDEAGNTLNDLLDVIAFDKALFDGFSIFVPYNANGKVAKLNYNEFSHVRFGLPDLDGNVWELAICNNWERDRGKMIDNKIHIYNYPTFNPHNVMSEFEEVGFFNHTGHIYVWTPKEFIYPECTFDSVFDQAQAQYELGVSELASVQNGFTATTIFKYPGTFETDDKRREFENKLREHKGAKGRNSTLVVENPGNEKLELIETLQLANTDKIFEFTTKDIKNALRENFAMPPEIQGIVPETGMFNQGNVERAYSYYNNIVQHDRDQISRAIRKILTHWNVTLPVTSWKIKPKSYVG